MRDSDETMKRINAIQDETNRILRSTIVWAYVGLAVSVIALITNIVVVAAK